MRDGASALSSRKTNSGLRAGCSRAPTKLAGDSQAWEGLGQPGRGPTHSSQLHVPGRAQARGGGRKTASPQPAAGAACCPVPGKAAAFVFSSRITIQTSLLHLLSIRTFFSTTAFKDEGGAQAGGGTGSPGEDAESLSASCLDRRTTSLTGLCQLVPFPSGHGLGGGQSWTGEFLYVIGVKLVPIQIRLL